jgi:hypothetical protein
VTVLGNRSHGPEAKLLKAVRVSVNGATYDILTDRIPEAERKDGPAVLEGPRRLVVRRLSAPHEHRLYPAQSGHILSIASSSARSRSWTSGSWRLPPPAALGARPAPGPHGRHPRGPRRAERLPPPLGPADDLPRQPAFLAKLAIVACAHLNALCSAAAKAGARPSPTAR